MDNTKQLDLILLTAGYLYSLTNDWEGKGQEWHINHFRDMYNTYNELKHDGDCTNKPWSCDMCFVEKYVDLAQSIINVNTLNDYLKELEE
jgi:hypothetical protein